MFCWGGFVQSGSASSLLCFFQVEFVGSDWSLGICVSIEVCSVIMKMWTVCISMKQKSMLMEHALELFWISMRPPVSSGILAALAKSILICAWFINPSNKQKSFCPIKLTGGKKNPASRSKIDRTRNKFYVREMLVVQKEREATTMLTCRCNQFIVFVCHACSWHILSCTIFLMISIFFFP